MIRLLACGILLLLSGALAAGGQSVDVEQARADDDFRWGVRAFHDSNFGDAVLSLEKSLSRKPAAVLPRVWLGNALYKNGFEEEALAEWRQALLRDPGDSLLRRRVQLTELRRGVAREHGPAARSTWWPRSSSPPLKRPTAVHARRGRRRLRRGLRLRPDRRAGREQQRAPDPERRPEGLRPAVRLPGGGRPPHRRAFPVDHRVRGRTACSRPTCAGSASRSSAPRAAARGPSWVPSTWPPMPAATCT